jgi:lipopolysaccharide transport system ATP-binding protein
MDTENIAIKVEDLSKLYRIGAKEKINETFGGALLGFLKSPVNNYRKYRSLYRFDDINLHANNGTLEGGDVLWALRDISFNVERGDAIGIIGRNGAGKSTLLKVLSRITHPTTGRIEITGKISSLLEVGTGFHPELTGSENIYLNGTILGMRKTEIDRKLDEIIDFSGVEKFLETPVKRYSSGMRVRLAFAVAAHLDPDILIIDEVLAVGDAAFQEKCIGKMQDVSEGGRTVIFVSHNMAAVSNLCRKAIFLDDGKIVSTGDSSTVIEQYLSFVSHKASIPLSERKDRNGAGEMKITSVDLMDEKGEIIEHPSSGRELVIRMHYRSNTEKTFRNSKVSAVIIKDEIPFMLLATDLVERKQLDLSGEGYIEFIVPDLPLSKGIYHITTFIESGKEIQDWVHGAAEMSVIDGDYYGTGRLYPPGWAGKNVLVKHKWRLGKE